MKNFKKIFILLFILFSFLLTSCWEKDEKETVVSDTKKEEIIIETEEVELTSWKELSDTWVIQEIWLWSIEVETWVIDQNINNGTWETILIEEKINEEEQFKLEALKKEETLRLLREKKDFENSNLAITTKDKNYCLKIYDEEKKQSCLDQIIISETQNSTNEKDCDAISDEYQRNLCKDNILQKKLTQSVTIFSEENTDYSNQTDNIITESTFEEKLALCNNMSEEQRKRACKNDLYYAKALEDVNKLLCNKIEQNDYDLSKCIKKVERLKRRR